MEDVLGKGWESHVEGQRLKEDGDNFKQKLDTQELFEDWSRKVGICSAVRFIYSKRETSKTALHIFLFSGNSPKPGRWWTHLCY